jgi:hypothetical protein
VDGRSSHRFGGRGRGDDRLVAPVPSPSSLAAGGQDDLEPTRSCLMGTDGVLANKQHVSNGAVGQSVASTAQTSLSRPVGPHCDPGPWPPVPPWKLPVSMSWTPAAATRASTSSRDGSACAMRPRAPALCVCREPTAGPPPKLGCHLPPRRDTASQASSKTDLPRSVGD